MAPFDGVFHQPPFWHRDAVRGPSTPSFDDLVGLRELPARRGATLGGLRALTNDHTRLPLNLPAVARETVSAAFARGLIAHQSVRCRGRPRRLEMAFLAKVSNVQLRDGSWHAGDRRTQRQRCIQLVDVDINPGSPYNPKCRFPVPLAPAGCLLSSGCSTPS